MKKNKIIIIISVALILVAAFLIYKNQFGTVRYAERDFAVKDTASVTKIFIADRNDNKVTLEKQADGSWMVDKKYPVRAEGLHFLFDCFSRIRVQSRVSKNTYNTVLKELSTTGIKCEIYLKNEDKPNKIYYVGGATQDNFGTFMMLENSAVPYVMEVPGFNGYLTPRYSPLERDWRSTRIIGVAPGKIKTIRLEYYDHPDKSFTIERSGNQFHITSPITHQQITQPDTVKLNIYLSYFSNLSFEAWDHVFKAKQIDSLKRSSPLIILTVEDISNNKTILPMYLKPLTEVDRAQLDSAHLDMKYDQERLYAFVNSGQDLVTLQYFVFNKVLVTFQDFDADLSRRKK